NVHNLLFFFYQAEDGIRDFHVTGVQTCALPISCPPLARRVVPDRLFVGREYTEPACRRVAGIAPNAAGDLQVVWCLPRFAVGVSRALETLRNKGKCFFFERLVQRPERRRIRERTELLGELRELAKVALQLRHHHPRFGCDTTAAPPSTTPGVESSILGSEMTPVASIFSQSSASCRRFSRTPSTPLGSKPRVAMMLYAAIAATCIRSAAPHDVTGSV